MRARPESSRGSTAHGYNEAHGYNVPGTDCTHLSRCLCSIKQMGFGPDDQLRFWNALVSRLRGTMKISTCASRQASQRQCLPIEPAYRFSWDLTFVVAVVASGVVREGCQVWTALAGRITVSAKCFRKSGSLALTQSALQYWGACSCR